MGSGYLDDPKRDVVALSDKGPISRPRVVLAFVVTPLLASLALAAVAPLYAGLPSYIERVLRTSIMYALFGAIPATLLFGVPGFLLLKKLLRPTLLWCAITGGFVAALPWILLVALSSGADNASINGHVTQVNGDYTAWGWLYFAQLIGFIFGAGALGGVIFWLIAAAPWRQRHR